VLTVTGCGDKRSVRIPSGKENGALKIEDAIFFTGLYSSTTFVRT
jgi:hypothetical protein